MPKSLKPNTDRRYTGHAARAAGTRKGQAAGLGSRCSISLSYGATSAGLWLMTSTSAAGLALRVRGAQALLLQLLLQQLTASLSLTELPFHEPSKPRHRTCGPSSVEHRLDLNQESRRIRLT